MGVPRLTRAAPAALALLWLGGCEPVTGSGRVAAVVAELRPDQPAARAAPPAYAEGDAIEHFDSAAGFFRVHFTRAGQHAVPLADADDSSVPDYVEGVADEYDSVLAFFRDELGMREPLHDDATTGGNGGDGRFDVYLLDFPNSADGAYRSEDCLPDAPKRCSGYMLQENDFTGRPYPSLEIATRVLASHELFHAVQDAYRSGAGSVIGEGTAVWASEAYDPSLLDFEALIDGYLERPERSLGQEPTGPVDAFSYGSALFFRYLQERWGNDVIRELWETLSDDGGAVENDASWLAALDALLARDHETSLADAYADFVAWNLHTGRRADARVSYVDGADYPAISERAIELPYRDQQVRVFPLSARHYAGVADRDGELQLEVIASEGGDLSGLHLLLAREARGAIAELQRVAVTEQETAVSLSVAEGDRIHAVVLNTRRQGESLQPALCLGTATAVRDCRAELGGGQPDASASQPEPEAGADDEPAGNAGGGNGGCSSTSANQRTNGLPRATPWSWLALLAAAWLRARRRHSSGNAMRESGVNSKKGSCDQ